MPRKRKRRGAWDESEPHGEHVVDQLYRLISIRKDARSARSSTARLPGRGRPQIAKKVGEEAVEALIEGVAGNGTTLVMESADLIYHLLALWEACGVEPAMVWERIAVREALVDDRGPRQGTRRSTR